MLHPIYFNSRLIRYALSEILELEASGRSGRLIKDGHSAAEKARRAKFAKLGRNKGARNPSALPPAPPVGFHSPPGFK